MQNFDQAITLLQSDDPESIREGARLAGESGMAAAIPYLLKHVSSPNIGVLEAVDRSLRKIGGPEVVEATIPLLRSEDVTCRNLAMDILRFLGASGVDSLAKLLSDDDPDIRIFGSDILGSVQSPLVIPHLCHALLHDPEANVRYQAAISLGELGEVSSADCLCQALSDEEWVQFAVIEALTKLKANSSIAALVNAFEHCSDLVSGAIVDALGEIKNIKAIPLLLKRLPKAPTPLANKIVKAIITILGANSLSLLGNKDCERLKGYMVTALEDEDISVQDTVIKGFGALGGELATTQILRIATKLNADRDAERLELMINNLVAAGMNDVLAKALQSEDEHTVGIAMAAIERIEDADIVPLLKDIFWASTRNNQRTMILELAKYADQDDQPFFLDILAKHTDGNVIRGALEFLGNKGNPAEVEKPILALLQHPYDDVKETALNAAIALGTSSIKEYFRSLAQDKDPIQRMIAIYAIGHFDINNFMTELDQALEDESPDVRRLAAEAIGKAHPFSHERIRLLKHKMLDENKDVRLAAVEALGKDSGAEIEDALIQGLDDTDPWVRVRCIEKLGDRKAEKSVAQLISLLNDQDNLVVIKSIEALGVIGGETAFRALLDELAQQDPDVQQAVAEAVEKIKSNVGA